MSVIEFFTNYWDWYLLIGFFTGMATTAEKGSIMDVDVGLFCSAVYLWPVMIIKQTWLKGL